VIFDLFSPVTHPLSQSVQIASSRMSAMLESALSSPMLVPVAAQSVCLSAW
jgi:hypothetical protein